MESIEPEDFYKDQESKINRLATVLKSQESFIHKNYKDVHNLYYNKFEEIKRDFRILIRLIQIQKTKPENSFLEWAGNIYFPKKLQVKNSHINLLEEVSTKIEKIKRS